MSLLHLIVVIIVCGVALWAVNAYIPMQAGLKQLLNVLVVAILAIVVIMFLLNMVGMDTGGTLRLS
jgi:hypothetical protein